MHSAIRLVAFGVVTPSSTTSFPSGACASGACASGAPFVIVAAGTHCEGADVSQSTKRSIPSTTRTAGIAAAGIAAPSKTVCVPLLRCLRSWEGCASMNQPR